jgi:hypothetical protein
MCFFFNFFWFEIEGAVTIVALHKGPTIEALHKDPKTLLRHWM